MTKPLKPLMTLGIGGCLALAIVAGCGQPVPPPSETADEIPAVGDGIPAFEYDPTWPKPLPNNWITGSIGAMAIDSQSHIWVAQRPGSTTNLSERYGLEGLGECCFPAPPVMEFDPEGNLIQAWGPIHDNQGQLLGDQAWGPYPDVAWPVSEHGIFVDEDTVWVGSQSNPSQILRFTRDGTFLMRIGQQEATSSNDPLNLAGPTGIVVDAETNEVFVADGYRNRRVVVFDADTGVYKRHWGAYGKQPPDGPQGGSPVEGPYDPEVISEQFATVHCLMMSRDGLLYVCDRQNNRIQVFQKGRHVRPGSGDRNEQGIWRGPRHWLLARSGAAISLRRRRREQEGLDPPARDAGNGGVVRQWRTRGREVPDRPRARGRRAGQRVRRGDDQQQPRAEVPLRGDATRRRVTDSLGLARL